jgi:hypothetical protein
MSNKVDGMFQVITRLEVIYGLLRGKGMRKLPRAFHCLRGVYHGIPTTVAKQSQA